MGMRCRAVSSSWKIPQQVQTLPPECTSVSTRSPSLNGHKENMEEDRTVVPNGKQCQHQHQSRLSPLYGKSHMGTTVPIELSALLSRNKCRDLQEGNKYTHTFPHIQERAATVQVTYHTPSLSQLLCFFKKSDITWYHFYSNVHFTPIMNLVKLPVQDEVPVVCHHGALEANPVMA